MAPSLDGIAGLLASEATVTLVWLQLLMLDLFQARYVHLEDCFLILTKVSRAMEAGGSEETSLADPRGDSRCAWWAPQLTAAR